MDAARQVGAEILAPRFRWTEDDQLAVLHDRLHRQLAHLVGVVGEEFRKLLADRTDVLHAMVENVPSDLDHLAQLDRTEVGRVELGFEPSAQQVHVRKRRRHRHDLNLVLELLAHVEDLREQQLQDVTARRVGNQVNLVDDNDSDVAELLLLQQPVDDAVGLLDGTNSEVDRVEAARRVVTAEKTFHPQSRARYQVLNGI